MKTTTVNNNKEEKEESIPFVSVKVTQQEVSRVKATIDFFRWLVDNRSSEEFGNGFSKSSFEDAREEYLSIQGANLDGRFDEDAYNAIKPGSLDFCLRLGLIKWAGRDYYTSVPRPWEKEHYVIFKDGTKMSRNKFRSLGGVRVDVLTAHGDIVDEKIMPKEKTIFTSKYEIVYDDYETYMTKVYLPSAQNFLDWLI